MAGGNPPDPGGVATVEDVDVAIASGPGLRWAVMGPTQLFHLGGDDGGIMTFCERYTESFHRWWSDLGDPRLDGPTIQLLADAMAESLGDETLSDLATRRDATLTAVIAATHSHRA